MTPKILIDYYDWRNMRKLCFRTLASQTIIAANDSAVRALITSTLLARMFFLLFSESGEVCGKGLLSGSPLQAVIDTFTACTIIFMLCNFVSKVLIPTSAQRKR